MKSLLTILLAALTIVSGCSRQSTEQVGASQNPPPAGQTPPAAEQPQTTPTPTPAKPVPSAPAERTTPPAVATARPITLEAGTSLRVRTTSALSTKTAEAGERFMATLAEPLVDGTTVIAPKGATVEGTVVESDDGGRVKGRSHISIALTTLHTTSGTIPISTNSIGREAAATKKKDATKIGIGAGVGAAIGAIAGGGKGAAIGTAVGAGAGTGAVLATKGDPAVIPAESLLTFKLRAPAVVRAGH